MQTLVIHTQYRENYAAHNEDYKHGIDEPYWKFKGGTTYFVDNLTSKQINKIAQEGIPTLTSLIEYSNEASEEYILDWEIRDLGKNGDGKGPMCEPWETPIQFYFEDGRWNCRTHHTPGPEYTHWNSAIIGKAEQWIPLPENERTNYACQYKTKNGWFDQNDAQLKQECNEAA
tara:strand:+ start:122 stop:640 length:519 start_codon:yes stop_codon:yes gene_type:complete